MNIEKAKKRHAAKKKLGRPKSKKPKTRKKKRATTVAGRQKRIKVDPEKPVRIIIRDPLIKEDKPEQRVVIRAEEEPEVEVEVITEETPEKKVIIRDIKPDKEMKELMELMEEFDEHELPLSTALFPTHRKTNQGYSFSEKMRAVSILRGTARDLNGKLIPYFNMVERWTGITAKTLHIWWANRETIIANSQGVVSEIETLAKYEISMMMLETINELRNRLAEMKDQKVSFQELTNLFDKSVNKLMIMTGKPQQPRRIDHFHHLPVNTIAPDTAD